MTQQSATLFTLTLRHLSTDGKKAGADLPKAQVPYVASAQLLSLLKSVAALAPSVAYPAEPEIRISGGSGEFVVRVKAAELHLVSWSSAHKGGVATPEQIVAAVTNEDGEEQVQGTAAVAGSGPKSWRDKLTMVGLGLAIIGVNSFTVWFLTLPPRTLVAAYRPLSPERAERVITEVAGIYETAKKERRIQIDPPAQGKRSKYAANGSVKEVQEFEIRPVDASGSVALLTSRKPPALITVKDPSSLILYGDTYTRVRLRVECGTGSGRVGAGRHYAAGDRLSACHSGFAIRLRDAD